MKFKDFKRIALVIVLGVFAYFVYANFPDFGILLRIKPFEFAILCGLFVLTLVLNGIFLKLQLKEFDVNISLREAFLLSVASTFGNNFLPFQGGAGIRAVYLKAKYKFSYSYFIASLAGLYVISFFSTAVLGIFSIVLLYLTRGIFNWIIFLLFFGLLVGTVVMININSSHLKLLPTFIQSKVKLILEGWEIISKSKKNLTIMSVLTSLNIMLAAFIMFYEFQILDVNLLDGSNPGMIDTMLISNLGVLSMFINITPSALGIKELILVASAGVLKISQSEIFVVSILERVFSYVVLVIVGPFSMYLLRETRMSSLRRQGS
jgi:uncharacterized protein (TIRG00374 family)